MIEQAYVTEIMSVRLIEIPVLYNYFGTKFWARREKQNGSMSRVIVIDALDELECEDINDINIVLSF